ncbi:hypothetical protein SLE2022_295920 [Rubroshorea leprosula]
MIKEAANPVPLPTHASSSTSPSVKAVTPPTTPNSMSQTFDISKSFDKDNYGPWLLVERRRSKRRPLPNSSTVEKIPLNPKAKDGRDSGGSTRYTGSKTQRVTNSSLSNQQNGNVLSALNADLSSKQSLTVQKAKAPLVDFSKPEPKTQQWVSKTCSKAQGPPKSITIQEPKSKSKNSPTQALPTHQSIASEPNPDSISQKLSIPHQDLTISSPISVQPNLITPVHSTSTSTSGIDPQTPLPQNSTQPLLNHGSGSNSASRSENPNVSGKGTIDRSDGDSRGVDTGLLIPQGIQMITESIVHSVESPHSHGHGDEPPRDGSLDPPSRGKFRFKRVMSDRESRIDRRRHYTRRGVEPYQAPAIDKFGLSKPLEVCPNRGENGRHPPDTKSPVVTGDTHREGLPTSFLTIPFSPSQVPLVDIPVPIAGVQPAESPDSVGAINHS